MALVQLVIGTTNGLFLYRADATRQIWQMDGPFLAGWSIDSVLGDSRHGQRIFAGISHPTDAPTIRLSEDGGATWAPLPHELHYPPASGLTVRRIWQITLGAPSQPDTYYAGVDEAGLFVSQDRGLSWQEVMGLNRHPARAQWRASRGGLTLHGILIDPTDPQRLWVAIASAGILRSEDGGAHWQACNDGLRSFATAAGAGYLVHKLAQDPHDPNVLYLQNIDGVYCTRDGAASWQTIEEGLPSTFGFPFGVDRQGNLYVVPLDGATRGSIDGRLCVYRRRAQEAVWQPLAVGLPTEPQSGGVLRDALTVDTLEPAGVYVGTTQGELFCSMTNGDHWTRLATNLGRITTLHAWVTDGDRAAHLYKAIH